jgi:hypothetical protein
MLEGVGVRGQATQMFMPALLCQPLGGQGVEVKAVALTTSYLLLVLPTLVVGAGVAILEQQVVPAS